MSTFKSNVPSEFICPLSMQVMIQPLVTKSGIHFERSAILQWLAQGSGVCPMTKQALKPSDLVPDKRLETRLQFWREQHGVVLSSVLRERKQEFIGICALGERGGNATAAVRRVPRRLFPRVFGASKVGVAAA